MLRLLKRYIYALLATGVCLAVDAVEITPMPIVFDAKREALSIEYIQQRYGITQSSATIEPNIVVVHWTVIPTLEKSFEVFNRSELPSSREKISAASTLNVSAHFLVDRDGSIYQLLPTTTFARHVIGLNYTAIGIENIADGKALPLTQEQIEANVALIKHLSTHHHIEYVIGHHEYQRFIGHPLWKEQNPNYLTEKNDPGDANMALIRSKLTALNLLPLPQP